MEIETIIILIQLIGITTLIFWFDTFAQSLLPLGIIVPKNNSSCWLGAVFVFLYPLFLGFSYWISKRNLLMKDTDNAIFWSIIPIIIFTIIFFTVKHKASHFQKSVKCLKRQSIIKI